MRIHGLHAHFTCKSLDCSCIGVLENGLSNAVIDVQDFYDRASATVSSVIATFATDRAMQQKGTRSRELREAKLVDQLGKRPIGLAALRTERADKALRGDAVDRRCE